MLNDPNITESLPNSLESWRRIDYMRDPEWSKPWENLRPFFSGVGYELYEVKPGTRVCAPRSGTPPAVESFGLYGDRNNFKSSFRFYAVIFAARDRHNRDVIIKVVSKGDEGRIEREILELLNSEPLCSDPANPTVQVIEFLSFQDFCFAVMPFCDGCHERPFLTAFECLDFAEQALEGLSFLHEHRIAHLDISNENILVNHHGWLPPVAIFGDPYEVPVKIRPPLPWRSTFPVRYFYIDFGCSALFKGDNNLSECNANPFPTKREQRPPEIGGTKPFNAFAADVYQIARLFYGWFPDLAKSQPDLLKLLQDMSSYNPSRRISASSAITRLRTLRASIPNDARKRSLLYFPLIPRNPLVTLRDVLECGQLILAFKFVGAILKMRLERLWTKREETISYSSSGSF